MRYAHHTRYGCYVSFSDDDAAKNLLYEYYYSDDCRPEVKAMIDKVKDDYYLPFKAMEHYMLGFNRIKSCLKLAVSLSTFYSYVEKICTIVEIQALNKGINYIVPHSLTKELE